MLRRLLTSVLAAALLAGGAAPPKRRCMRRPEFEDRRHAAAVDRVPAAAGDARQAEDRADRAAARGKRRARHVPRRERARRRSRRRVTTVRVLTPEEVSADPALQELVLDARRRYTEMLTQVRLRLPRQIGKRRYEAGDEMRVLASKLGVDAVGFAEIQIYAAARRRFGRVDPDGLRRIGLEHADLRQRDRRRDGEYRGVLRAAGAATRLDRGLRRDHGRPGRPDRRSSPRRRCATCRRPMRARASPRPRVTTTYCPTSRTCWRISRPAPARPRKAASVSARKRSASLSTPRITELAHWSDVARRFRSARGSAVADVAR